MHDMAFPAESLTRDAFLDGRLTLAQPASGYRAATDPVFLAASVPAFHGQSVLELGCGAGVALATLSRRVTGLDLHGLEFQPDYAALARQNAAENGLILTIHDGDLAEMPPELRALSFDHVIANPPFFDDHRGTSPRDIGKARAQQQPNTALAVWVDAMLRRLRPRGMVSLVHRAEALGDILGALSGRAGDITVLPLTPREGRAAGRVIVQAIKGAGGPLRLLAPLIVHCGAHHGADDDAFSPVVRGVLRDMAALDLTSARKSI